MKIGISACLLGSNCRYDGGHSRDRFIVDTLSEYFEFTPLCPESMILPTPRDTIRLVEDNEEIRVLKSKDNKEELTRELNEVSQGLVNDLVEDELCGFILKSKSPTCGMERVKVYSAQTGQSQNKGVGVFAAKLKEKYPYLPIEEEGRLGDPWLRENFIMQVFAYKSIFEFMKSNIIYKDLVDFHTSYKYLIYAKSQKSYKLLGSIVANHKRKELDEVLNEYKQEFLKAISIKGSISNAYNVLLHIFGYFKKHITSQEKHSLLEALEDFKKEIVPIVTVIRLFKLYIEKFDISYLKVQTFLSPYPKELALRSNIKAYR